MLLHHGTPSSATVTNNDIAAATTAGRTPATAQPTAAATAAAAHGAPGADCDSRCGYVSTRPCQLKPAAQWSACTSKVKLLQRLGGRLIKIWRYVY